jgi:hypothetical protein
LRQTVREKAITTPGYLLVPDHNRGVFGVDTTSGRRTAARQSDDFDGRCHAGRLDETDGALATTRRNLMREIVALKAVSRFNALKFQTPQHFCRDRQ